MVKKRPKPDFVRKRRKVGKKAPPAASNTKTSFSTRRIFVSAQSVGAAAQQAKKEALLATQRRQTLSELLRKYGHPRPGVRLEALRGLREVLQRQAKEAAEAELPALLRTASEGVRDSDGKCRNMALLLWDDLLSAVNVRVSDSSSDEANAVLEPFLPLIAAHLGTGLSHASESVPRDALRALGKLVSWGDGTLLWRGEKRRVLTPLMTHVAACCTRFQASCGAEFLFTHASEKPWYRWPCEDATSLSTPDRRIEEDERQEQQEQEEDGDDGDDEVSPPPRKRQRRMSHSTNSSSASSSASSSFSASARNKKSKSKHASALFVPELLFILRRLVRAAPFVTGQETSANSTGRVIGLADMKDNMWHNPRFHTTIQVPEQPDMQYCYVRQQAGSAHVRSLNSLLSQPIRRSQWARRLSVTAAGGSATGSDSYNSRAVDEAAQHDEWSPIRATLRTVLRAVLTMLVQIRPREDELQELLLMEEDNADVDKDADSTDQQPLPCPPHLRVLRAGTQLLREIIATVDVATDSEEQSDDVVQTENGVVTFTSLASLQKQYRDSD